MAPLTLKQVAQQFGAGPAPAYPDGIVWPTAVSGWVIEGTCDPEGGVRLRLRHRLPDGAPCDVCDTGKRLADATALNIDAVPVVLNALRTSVPARAAECCQRAAEAA